MSAFKRFQCRPLRRSPSQVTGREGERDARVTVVHSPSRYINYECMLMGENEKTTTIFRKPSGNVSPIFGTKTTLVQIHCGKSIIVSSRIIADDLDRRRRPLALGLSVVVNTRGQNGGEWGRSAIGALREFQLLAQMICVPNGVNASANGVKTIGMVTIFSFKWFSSRFQRRSPR